MALFFTPEREVRRLRKKAQNGTPKARVAAVRRLWTVFQNKGAVVSDGIPLSGEELRTLGEQCVELPGGEELLWELEAAFPSKELTKEDLEEDLPEAGEESASGETEAPRPAGEPEPESAAAEAPQEPRYSWQLPPEPPAGPPPTVETWLPQTLEDESVPPFESFLGGAAEPAEANTAPETPESPAAEAADSSGREIGTPGETAAAPAAAPSETAPEAAASPGEERPGEGAAPEDRNGEDAAEIPGGDRAPSPAPPRQSADPAEEERAAQRHVRDLLSRAERYLAEGRGPEAAACLEEAADRRGAGSLETRLRLTSLYREGGPRLPADMEKARYWGQRAASLTKGAPPRLQAAWLFLTGENQDLQKARYWAEAAADAGSEEAKNLLNSLDDMEAAVEQNAAAGACRFKREEYDQALPFLLSAAQYGMPLAAYLLGKMYGEGLGVEQDRGESLRWFEKAAGSGWTEAALELVDYYSEESPDRGKALSALELLGRQGDGDVCLALAGVYGKGEGVPRDWERCFRWATRAAAEGSPGGAYLLAQLYYNGRGTAADFPLSALWARKAKEGGCDAAEELRLRAEDAALSGGGRAEPWHVTFPEEEYTPEREEHPLEELAEEFLSGDLSEDDFLDATAERELQAGFRALERGAAECAERRFESAGKRAGLAGRAACAQAKALSQGPEADDGEAVELLLDAADREEPEALEALGDLALQERGGMRPADAKALFERAVKAGSVSAMVKLGRMYESGSGAKRNEATARRWYEKAAAAGSEEARSILGEP